MKNRQFLLLLLLVTMLSWLGFHGIAFSDEHEYARIAYQISQGVFQNTGHHFDNRFGLTLPMAGLIWLTDISTDRIYIIWSLFSFWGLLWVINWLFKGQSRAQKSIWVLAFLAMNPALLYLSSDIAPDLVMTMWVYLSLVSLWKVRQGADFSNLKRILHSFIFSFGLFAAFCTKLTMAFCLPFFAILFFIDLFKKQNLAFWGYTILATTLFLLSYFGLYQYYVENPFFRFTGIEAHHGTEEKMVLWNYANRPLKDYLIRVTAYPIGFFLNSPSYALLGIPALFFFKSFSTKKLKEIEHYFYLFILTTGFCFWFGSTSLKQYNPVILVDRMLLPLIPALIIVGVVVIQNLSSFIASDRPQIKLIFGLILLICLAGLLYFNFEHIGFIFSMILIVLLWFELKLQKKNSYPLFIFIFICYLGISVWQIWTSKVESSYFVEKAFFSDLPTSKPTIIYTDPNTADMYKIYFGFQPPTQLEVYPFHEYDFGGQNSLKIIHRNDARIESQLKYHDYVVADSIFTGSRIILKNQYFELRKPIE